MGPFFTGSLPKTYPKKSLDQALIQPRELLELCLVAAGIRTFTDGLRADTEVLGHLLERPIEQLADRASIVTALLGHSRASSLHKNGQIHTMNDTTVDTIE